MNFDNWVTTWREPKMKLTCSLVICDLFFALCRAELLINKTDEISVLKNSETVTKGNKTTNPLSTELWNQFDSENNYFVNDFFVICVLCASGVIIRSIISFTSITVPYSVVMLMFGAAIGYIGNNYENVQPYVTLSYINPEIIMMLYLPIMVFNTAYNTDTHAFLKNFNQIFLIAVLGMLLVALIASFMATYIINELWSFKVALLYGLVCSPIYPVEMVSILSELAHSKYLAILLQGEGIVGEITVVTVFNIVFALLAGALTTPLAIFLVFSRLIGGGLLLGIVSGFLSAQLLSLKYNDLFSAVTITLTSSYLTYYIGERILYVSGLLAVVVTGLQISRKKSILANEVEIVMHQFWNIAVFLGYTILFPVVGMIIFHRTLTHFSLHQVALVFVTYMAITAARFIVYVLLTPLLRLFGNALPWRHVIAAIWGGVRGPLSLCLALIVLNTTDNGEVGQVFVIQVTGLVFLTLLFNATTMYRVLEMLGMTELSLAKKANMTNCVKRIMLTRDRCISMLKLDKYLADANWELVEKGTCVKHPYKIQYSARDDSDEDDDTYMGYRFTTCPDCSKEVPNEPTKKEYYEMLREANQRVLKAMKISFWRQYEHGKLSKEAVRTLVQAVEIINDPDGKVNLDQLGLLWKPKKYAIWIRRKLMIMMSPETGKQSAPNHPCRLRSFNIVVNFWFDVFIYIAILCNTPIILCEVLVKPPVPLALTASIKILNTTFFTIYIGEMVLKMSAFGIRGYFSSHWNKFDFIIILFAICDFVMDIIDTLSSWDKWSNQNSSIITAAKLLRMLRFLRLFKLAKAFLPKGLAYMDTIIDLQLAYGYDVGKGFMTSQEEVHKLLPQLVDNIQIQKILKAKLEEDRQLVAKQLGHLQRDRPWTAITVKTRQATRCTLYIMMQDAVQLKEEGFLDEVEYKLLLNSIRDSLLLSRHKASLVAPCSPEVQLRGVNWLVGNERVADFLMEYAEIVNFNYGDIIITRGTVPKGLYILVSGVLESRYFPMEVDMGETIPNNDFMNDINFSLPSVDYIVSGNAVGVLGVLTNREYDCTVTCDTAVQAYYINMETMRGAFNMAPHPIYGLEACLWRSIGIKLALLLLPFIPTYSSYTPDRLSMKLENAFVPCLKAFKVFVVNEFMEDVILIDGVCQDYNTSEIFTPPCYIPRTAHKLIFPKSSQLVVTGSCPETKLLIIPAKDVDEIDIMEDEVIDMQCELVNNVSSRCLYHHIQVRLSADSRGALPVVSRKGRKRRRGAGRRVNYRDSTWSRGHANGEPSASSVISVGNQYYKSTGYRGELFQESKSALSTSDLLKPLLRDQSTSHLASSGKSIHPMHIDKQSELEIYAISLSKSKTNKDQEEDSKRQ